MLINSGGGIQKASLRREAFIIRCVSVLTELASTIADDNIDDNGLLAILCFELLNNNFLEVGSKFVCYEVDGATTEAATHDA